jgi:hypothetical protein
VPDSSFIRQKPTVQLLSVIAMSAIKLNRRIMGTPGEPPLLER